MDQPFPGKDKMTPEIELDFRRKAIDRAWKHIRGVTKKTKPDCIIWLTCYDLNSKEIAGSDMLKEIDWLMNEAGDMASIEAVRSKVGSHTKLITCLANWNKQNPAEVVPAAIKSNVGLYSFTKPFVGALMPPVDMYLSQPVSEFIENGKNVAILARTYKGLTFEFVKK